MNLLVIDATQPRVQFAVFSAARRVEEVLSGHFDAEAGDMLVIADAGGAVLNECAVPPGVGLEACLAQVMQWLGTRQIRIDAVAHRQGGSSARAVHYLRTAHAGVPQVVCLVDVEGGDLAPLARGALVAMANPVPAVPLAA